MNKNDIISKMAAADAKAAAEVSMADAQLAAQTKMASFKENATQKMHDLKEKSKEYTAEALQATAEAAEKLAAKVKNS